MKEVTINGIDVNKLLSSKPKEILHFLSVLDVHKCKEYGDFNFLLISEAASTHWRELEIEQMRMLRYIKMFIQVVERIKTEEIYPLSERYLRWIPLIEILP